MLRLAQIGRKIREIPWSIFHYFFFFSDSWEFVESEACNLINPQMGKISTHISVCVYSYELSLAMLKN